MQETPHKQPHLPPQPTGEPASSAVNVLLAGMVVTPAFREAIFAIPTDKPDIDIALEIRNAAQHAPGEEQQQLLALQFTPNQLETIQKAIHFVQHPAKFSDGTIIGPQEPMQAFAEELSQDELPWLKK